MASKYEKCLNDALRAIGHRLTPDQVKELAKDLSVRMRRAELHRRGNNPRNDASDIATEFATEEAQRIAREYRNKYLSLQAKVKALTYIQDVWSDDPWEGLAAIYAGANLARRGAKLSVEAESRALLAQHVSALDNDIGKLGEDVYKIARRGDMDKHVYIALEKMYKDEQDFSDIPREARQIAEVLYKHNEYARKEINHHGAWQSRSSSHISGQTHDPWKLRRAMHTISRNRSDWYNTSEEANFRAWRDYVLPLLDHEETFKYTPEGNEDEFLRQVYRNLVSGNHLSHESPYEAGRGGHPSRAARLSRRRVLHFADGEARYKYDSAFARGHTITERTLFHMEQRARDIALLKLMGPNPRDMHEQLKTAVQLMGENSIAGREKSAGNLSNRYKQKVDAYFAQVNGDAAVPGNHMLASTMMMFRTIQSISKLGMAVLSSFGDTLTAASVLQYNGVGLTRAYGSQFQSLFEGISRNDNHRFLAQHLGTMTDSLRTGLHSRFGTDEHLPGIMARLVHTFFKWNGLSWYTDVLRMGNARTLSLNLAYYTDSPYGGLSGELKRALRRYDIMQDEWELMRGVAKMDVEDRAFFIPEQAHTISDNVIKAHLLSKGIEPTKRRIRDTKDDLQRKFRAYFSNEANDAVIQPNARVQATVDMSYVPGVGQLIGGELGRELGKTINQFKSYPIAILDQHIGRFRYGYSEDPSLKKLLSSREGGSAVLAMAQFLAMSVAIGYMSLAAKDLVKGRKPRHFMMQNAEGESQALSVFAQSLLQGGGLGFYGDLFIPVNARQRYGHSALATYLGPTWQNASDIYGLYVEGNVKAAQAFKIAANNTPFANIWWAKAGFDYLFYYRVQEMLSPGSVARMEQILKDETGQEFFLPPPR